MSDLPELSKFQTFTIERISREGIQSAEYNPRIISEAAAKKLKAGLKKHGLVATITMNRRTGNIVGGHQRLSQLDILHRGKPYSLDVAMVDVDEKEEAALNVLLNNQANQGEFDAEMLENMIAEFDLDPVSDMGFELDDLAVMGLSDTIMDPSAEVQEEAAKTAQGITDANKSIRANQKTKDAGDDYQASTDDYMLGIVFKTEAQKHRFCERMRVATGDKFVTYDHFRKMFREGFFENFFDTDDTADDFKR